MKTLLHFSADWCNPCKVMQPFIDEFVSNNPDVDYTKIDVDKNLEITKNNNVMSIPTIIAFVDGVEIKRHRGVAQLSDLNSLFD